MYLGLLLFFAGVCFVPLMPVLPGFHAGWLITLGVVISLSCPRFRPISGLFLGLLVAINSGHEWLANNITRTQQATPVMINAMITSPPVSVGDYYRFLVKVKDGEFRGRKILMSWYGPSPPAAGETWRFNARLQAPGGTVNLGLFDYEAWMLSQGIHGTGYVLLDGVEQRMAISPMWNLHYNWRQKVKRNLSQMVLPVETKGMLQALLIGESGGLQTQTWDLLSKTGTNHLFVVSGLHVGMVAAILLWLLRILGISSWLSVVISIVGLGLYSLVVGFGLPVQRAFLMSVVGLLFIQSRREVALWRVLLWVLTVVLFFNPFSVLSAGFWLSFGAVAGLVFAFSGWQRQSLGYVTLLTRTQIVALVATAPALLFWVGAVSLISVCANLVAVPLMGVVIVPLIFSYLFASVLDLHDLAEALLVPLGFALNLMLGGLRLLAELDWVYSARLMMGHVLLLALCGGLVLLIPKNLVPRWFGVFLWLPVGSYTQQQALVPVKQGDLRVDVLDVGQGLSVVITGASTTIIYDTGPSFGTRDSGMSTLVPTLKRLGRDTVDLLVVSHGDDDHAGGARSLLRTMPVQMTLSSDPEFGASCQGGYKDFGDVSVKWYSAQSTITTRSNDLSCVLRIDSEQGSVLLPGDIESRSEVELIAQLSPASMVLSPHHGSRSSSTPAFINAVSPHWVVHSAGKDNRFGHPHEVVEQRYQNRGIKQFQTSQSGSISFIYTRHGVRIRQARSFRPRFWYDPPLSQF